MKRYRGLHKVGSSPLQKAISYLDRDVSKMVLERDEKEGCITCGAKNCKFDNGHFRIRQNMSTRFHPLNCNKQCQKDNRFAGGKTFEYGVALDKKYGKGCALFLERLSRKIENWDVNEVNVLRDAAKRGWRVYEQVFYELRPNYKFKKL